MHKNIGTVDRLIRLGLGLLFLVLAYIYASWILALVGVFCVFEALFSWCAFYQLLGKNSCDINQR